LTPVFAIRQPRQKFAEPRFDTGLIGFGPRLRTCKQPDRIDHTCKAAAFDDAKVSARVLARDRLGILKIRVHSRWRIEKPHSQDLTRSNGVLFFSRQEIAERKR